MSKFSLFIVLAVFTISLCSSAMGQVSLKQVSNDFVLVGVSCESLATQAKALASWSKTKSKAECQCLKNQCELVVTELIPSFAKKTNGVCTVNSGPNCWNTALISSGVLSSQRYTTPEEMKFWMSSPLCKKRESPDKPRPGDIVAIRGGAGSYSVDLHGFVYISDELSFGKNGPEINDPYEFKKTSEVFKVNQIPKECQTSRHSDCLKWAEYYQCESMESYLAQNPIKNSEQKLLWNSVEAQECSSASVLSIGAVELNRVALESMMKLADEKRASPEQSEEEKFLWNGILIKAKSLWLQNRFVNIELSRSRGP